MALLKNHQCFGFVTVGSYFVCWFFLGLLDRKSAVYGMGVQFCVDSGGGCVLY